MKLNDYGRITTVKDAQSALLPSGSNAGAPAAYQLVDPVERVLDDIIKDADQIRQRAWSR